MTKDDQLEMVFKRDQSEFETWFNNIFQPFTTFKLKSESFYIVFTISKSLCTRKVDSACFSVLSSS